MKLMERWINPQMKSLNQERASIPIPFPFSCCMWTEFSRD
jgi:hypothetical protein